MRQRRGKRNFRNNDLLDYLQIISKVLFVLIIIFLVIFINSSITVKKSTLISKNDNKPPAIIEENIAENSVPENVILKTNTTNTTSSEIEIPKDQGPKSSTINMAFTGDITGSDAIYEDALDKTLVAYDFSHIFEDVRYFIQTADIAIGNLNTNFAGPTKKYSNSKTYNTPENLAYNLKKVGFDVLSTATTHCYDFGYEGLESTIKYLDEADLAHTGTYKSEETKNQILIRNVKGIQIAFLSFTYGTNGNNIPPDKSYSVNLANEENILNQLSLAKGENPDLICVNINWGNAQQKELADLLFKNGADIIIGNNSNVLQSMEKREITLEDNTTKDGFIVYSLGNFLAEQNKSSVILNLNITKDPEGKISINSATYTPIYTYKDTSVDSKKFKMLNLKNTIASIEAGYDTNIDKKVYTTFKTELDNIKKLIGEEIKS